MADTLVQNMARLIKIKKADAFKHTQIIEECMQNGTKFTDPDFPPEESSLIRRPETPAKWRTYVWRRASEFMPADKISIFQNIDPGDILQGQLGDCYFLSCLSVLAERPKLIQRLFLTEQPNEAGCYAIWLNDNGEWKNFIVDDYFPCTGPRTGPAFTRGNGFELWVLLLEKAYAKLHGSYDIIEGGDPAWALRDLTGAPWDFLDSPDPNAVWAFVMESQTRGYLATCYTKSTAIREEQNSLGIVYGHAYSILDAKEITAEEGQVRLIQIRNPWGKFEWKGDWGDDSDKWTENAKAQVNYENRDDGTFWMNVTDFVNYYEGVGICKLHENYQYKSISFDHKESGRNYSICRLVIPEKTHAFLSVNQKDDRGFNAEQNYQYSTMRVTLGKIEENGLTYIDGKFFNDRNLVLENDLEPGYYILVMEIYWRQDFYKTINLSAYSERKIEFEEVARAEIGLIERNLLKSYIHSSQIKKKNYAHLSADNIFKYTGTHLGMIFFYYNNQEEDKQLNETVRATKFNNLQIQQPFTDNESFSVQVLPQDDCLVYFKIVNENEAYAFSPSTSSDVVEPSSEEIEANRHKAYRGTTYIDDPNDKTGESRDVSYYDDYIKNNVDLYPEDPTNMVEIIANKKEPLEIMHPVSNPQKDLSDQYGYQKREGVGLVPEAPSIQVSGLFDIKLWRNFPKYLSDDTRLGKWEIQGFERTFSDMVNPVFSSSFADSIFEVLMCLIVVATLLISLLRPQFLDIALITSLVFLVICRHSVIKVSNNNLVLRVSPFLFFLSCFLDISWLFVYGKNWPTKDATDDGMLSGVKSFVILMSVISLISKFIFSLILWWKVILALKTKK